VTVQCYQVDYAPPLGGQYNVEADYTKLAYTPKTCTA
jgi:hypothetical protein